MHMELKVRHKQANLAFSTRPGSGPSGIPPSVHSGLQGPLRTHPGTQPTPGDPVEEPDTGDSSGPSPTPGPHICDAGSALKTLAFESTAGVEVLGPTQSAWKWL